MAKFLIVEARFYDHLNDLLLDGARTAIEAAGHSHETVTVPGALEVPGAIALASESGRYDAYIALGVVIAFRYTQRRQRRMFTGRPVSRRERNL